MARNCSIPPDLPRMVLMKMQRLLVAVLCMLFVPALLVAGDEKAGQVYH